MIAGGCLFSAGQYPASLSIMLIVAGVAIAISAIARYTQTK